MTTDRRALFANGRVAHSSLKGQITSDLFTDGHLMRVCVPVADLRVQPADTSLSRQILFGHPVRLLDPQSGFCRDETSGYVGYVAPSDLCNVASPTHRVASRASLLFTAPDFKSPNPAPLSCGSLLTLTEKNGRYGKTNDGRFAILDHLIPVQDMSPDLAGTAERLLGTPYLWGGNSAFGIDCSGLVQLALQAAGLPCPGDSDQQMDRLGRSMPPDTPAERGDLFFWKGHVALALDADTLIHANAFHMAVATENLNSAIKRIKDQGDGPVLAHKRLAF